MNTITFKVPVEMAREIAKATDILKMPSNDAFAFHATRLMLRSVLGKRRGRPYKQIVPTPRSAPRRAR